MIPKSFPALILEGYFWPRKSPFKRNNQPVFDAFYFSIKVLRWSDLGSRCRKRYEDWAIRLKKAGEGDPRVEDFRWGIEELRVSLYAQELKTPYPVSYKRLDKLWGEISKA